MKILFWRLNILSEVGIINAFRSMGIELHIHKYNPASWDYDKTCLETLSNYLVSDNFDCVFSVNYVPIISRVCEVHKVPYLSWVVDCPCFPLYSKTISNSMNRIFLFDYAQYQKFHPKNPNGIFYQALGSDVTAFDRCIPTSKEKKNYTCDISFVGSLYTEKCTYSDLTMPPMLKGYLNGLIDAQLLIQGYNFLEDVLTLDVCNEFRKYSNWSPLAEDYEEDVISIVADSCLGPKITEQDRIRTLNAIAKTHSLHLYTLSDTSTVPNVINKGPADSDNMMPYIFKCSKINLNITSKSIKTGLPLRIFDILACQGFLITNFQPEIPEYFEDGVHLVTYNSIPDLLEKVDYYLKHEDERLKIAKNGYEKVKNHYTYIHRLNQMICTAWNL